MTVIIFRHLKCYHHPEFCQAPRRIRCIRRHVLQRIHSRSLQFTTRTKEWTLNLSRTSSVIKIMKRARRCFRFASNAPIQLSYWQAILQKSWISQSSLQRSKGKASSRFSWMRSRSNTRRRSKKLSRKCKSQKLKRRRAFYPTFLAATKRNKRVLTSKESRHKPKIMN